MLESHLLTTEYMYAKVETRKIYICLQRMAMICLEVNNTSAEQFSC